MTENELKPFRRAFRQTPALVALAVLLAVGVNHWRPDGIPLVGDWSEESRFSDASGDSMVISLDRARELFERDAALFVDSRPKDQCDDGRIQGALCIPWREVDRYFMEAADQLEGADAIITYCDGESCDLSHDLAIFLKDMGFDDVHVLVNGWTIWKQAGLPTEEG